MIFRGNKVLVFAVFVAGSLDVGQGDRALVGVTNWLRATIDPTPEGYDQEYNPDQARESFDSEVNIFSL